MFGFVPAPHLYLNPTSIIYPTTQINAHTTHTLAVGNDGQALSKLY